MKKINIIYISFLAILVLFSACQNDDLLRANFNLDAVTVFSGEVAHEQVTLNWELPKGKVMPEGYILNWSPDGTRIIVDGTTTSYKIKGLTNGIKYKFTIQADYGETGISGPKEIEITPKDELNLKALPGKQFVLLQWTTPKRDDIASYSLSWEDNVQVIQIPVNKTSYQVTGLDNGVEYTFSLVINYTDGTTSKGIKAKATPGDISAFLLSVNSPMAKELVQFTYNPAYLPGSTAVTWNWNFGDGTTSTVQNPTHKYSTPGIYNVSILIVDGQGNIFNDTQKVYVWGEKWAYDLGFQINTQCPAVASDGTIYIGSEDNNNFHAINPNGTLKWTYKGLSDNVYSSASIGNDGTIYVGSKDDYLHAINPDGSQKWKFNTGGDIIYSTPAIASDGTIYIGSDSDNLFAVNPSGTQKWAFKTTGFNIRSSPAIATNGTVYIASDDKSLYALNASNGTVLWAFPVGGLIQSGIAIDSDGTIIVGVDQGGSAGAVYAINPDGSKKWSINVTGRISVCAPAIANNTVYVGTKEGNNLLALNASNGAQKWSFSTLGSILNSSPAVDANGVIYFGSWDNNLYAVNPDGTLKYKFLTGGILWSSPTVGSDGTVYIGGYDNKLHALEMFSGGLATGPWPMFGKNAKHTSR